MKNLTLTAAVKSNGKDCEILAYSGGLMTVPGWGPVVIDLPGLDASGQIKLVSDHDTTLDGLAGYGTAKVKSNRLFIFGKILDTVEAGQRIIELAKEGIEFQASVGVDVFEAQYIQAGDSIEANGQTIESDKDFTLIKKGQLREVTICLLGCDQRTAVKIAAQKILGVQTMSKQISVEQVKEIRQTTALYAAVIPAKELREIEDTAIEAGWDANQTSKECMSKMDLTALRASRASAPAANIGGNHNFDLDKTKVLEAGILLMNGRQSVAEKCYDPKVLQAAHDLHLTCALHLCDAALKLHGQTIPSSQGDLLKASFSTTSLPNALANSMTKELTQAFEAAPATWRSIAAKKSAKNFHSQSALRGVLKDGIYKVVGPGGELEHGSLLDEAISYRVDTRGLMFGVTRKDIINDELGIFFDLQKTLGFGASRSINKLFWQTIIAASTFFTAGNANYAAGTNTVLSIDALSAAILLLRSMVDGDGNPVGITPTVLAVPPALEGVARQLLSSLELYRTSADKLPVNNPWQGLNMKLEVEPYLTANSAKAWYLFGDPNLCPAALVSFLNGVETPTVETSDADFNKLGQQYRAYLDFGVDMGDSRGGVKMLGEAEPD